MFVGEEKISIEYRVVSTGFFVLTTQNLKV